MISLHFPIIRELQFFVILLSFANYVIIISPTVFMQGVSWQTAGGEVMTMDALIVLDHRQLLILYYSGLKYNSTYIDRGLLI